MLFIHFLIQIVIKNCIPDIENPIFKCFFPIGLVMWG
uniref:Uncharacterized protein n=1 Tax=Anguilla anguilla TaxID=7936 RepID=A0A0E9Q4X7_ANGAN